MAKRPLPKMGNSWKSPNDLREMLSRARTNKEQYQRLIDGANAKISIREATLMANLKDLDKVTRDKAVGRGLIAFKAELKAQTEEARTQHIRTAGGMRETAISIRRHYNSPTQMLSRHNLGSEKRSRLLEQLAHAGHAELLSLAELAAATGDRDLGAALASRVYSLPADKRPFDVHELSEVLIGEEFNEMAGALEEIESLAVDLVRIERAFETGRMDGVAELEAAFRKKRAEELYGSDDDDDSSDEGGE